MDKKYRMSHKVIVNYGRQYLIWPAHAENPGGWKEVGKTGSEEECLDYVQAIWKTTNSLASR